MDVPSWPLASECKTLKNAFRRAIKGSEASYDRASRPLQQVLLLGHSSDIAFLAAQHCLCALARWARLLVKQGLNPEVFRLQASSVGKAVTSTLAQWNWTPLRWGAWGAGRSSFDVSAQLLTLQKAAHELRDAWRVSKVTEWINAPTRIDSRLAREVGLRPTQALVRRICTGL